MDPTDRNRIRLAGIAGILGALFWILGDALIVGGNATPADYPLLMRDYASRIAFGALAETLPSSETRLAAGALIANLAVPLYLLGSWHFYRGVLPGGRALAAIAFGLLICGNAWSPLGHAAFYFIALVYKTIPLVPVNAHDTLLGLGDQFHRVLMIAWLLPITALTLGLLCVGLAILRGKTGYPRGAAAFLNPVAAMAVGIALPYLMPSPLGIWLHGAGINIGWLFVYAQPLCSGSPRRTRRPEANYPFGEARHFCSFLAPRFPGTISFACTVISTSSSAVIARNEDDDPTRRNLMSFRTFGAAAAITAALALTAPAHAVTEIQWWHAMTGGNNDVIVKLANDFNASQKDYKVVPTYKGGYADTMNAGIAAFRAGHAPAIMQVFEVGTATMMAATGAVKPVYKLMQETGEKFDPKAYLPTITGYYSTSKGEMLSFPFNSSSTVMWINLDALKKANISEIPKTWPQVFEDAKKLKAAGYTTCGFSNAWVTWVNLEQLSAWHNVPLATKANGLDGFDTKLVFNGPLQVRHLQNLIDLQKDKTYDYSGRTNTGEGRFTSGECPIFLTSSGFFGNVQRQAKFHWTNAPMPYYPDVKGAPQNSIIGGASLWVMGGQTPEVYKGVAKFLAFLSDTDRQVYIHEASGYLPITKAAYAKAKADGYYKDHPYLETPLLELTNKPPTENSRGLRLGNMVQLRDVWAEEIEQALAGKKTAQQALDAAVERGNVMLRQFEKTNVH